ncbi:MAG: AAA-associated domain-containing protein [Thermofilaceae archaeon]
MVEGVDQGDSSRRGRQVLPPDVTPDHVLGLVELLHSLGSGIDSMYVGDAISEDVSMLPHAIDVAEALGLIAQREGNLELTDRGRQVASGNPKTVKRLLQEVVLRLEPFNEIVEKLREKSEMPVEEFEEILEKVYPTQLEQAKHNILVWGAFLGLFKMSEDDERIVAIHIPRARETQGRARGGEHQA